MTDPQLTFLLGHPLSGQGCDGLDLNKLAGIAEHRHPNQSARRVVTAEVPPDDVPGGDQVSAVVTGHVHGRLHDIFKTGTRSLKCRSKV